MWRDEYLLPLVAVGMLLGVVSVVGSGQQHSFQPENIVVKAEQAQLEQPKRPLVRETLIWPFYGAIASPYGPGHPLGIDMDGYEGTRSREGEPVLAATAGTVVFAGGNPCCSYGNYVVIISPGGIETLYAHMQIVSVEQGQTVVQGQEVGKLGDTGYSTGPHLHFEVIDNGVRQNPIEYLP